MMFLNQNRLLKLEERLKMITIRGYDERYRPEADLSKYRIGVHLLADYCPTDRYIYISVKMPEIELQKTWKGLQGKIIEDTYIELYNSAKTYILNTSLRNLDFSDLVSSTTSQISESKREHITRAIDSLNRRPRGNEIDSFLDKLKTLVEYELLLFSSHMQFLISKKYNINRRTEFQTVFDFILKHTIDGTRIGLTENITPDFIYLRRVIGDIKTGEWEEFFRVMVAAYAMAYEASEQSNIDCGIVLNPSFMPRRKVPLYKNSSIFIVDDVLRKGFLAKRNQKLKILKEESIPQAPPDDSKCRDCGYWDFCWGENE
jgi:CRISPR/Cas system-associated exonuclease Cas4 (RecB family)